MSTETMNPISQAVESLDNQLQAAQEKYQALVRRIAEGGQTEQDDFLILNSAGKSSVGFQSDVCEAAAKVADQQATIEAGRLNCEYLPKATAAQRQAVAQLESVEKICRAIVFALVDATRKQLDSANEKANDLRDWIVRLQRRENYFMLKRCAEMLDDARRRLVSAGDHGALCYAARLRRR